MTVNVKSMFLTCKCILPGLMDTPHIYQEITGFYGSRDEMAAARHATSPTGRMGEGWDIANAAVFLASDEAKYINGIELVVDGGWHVRAA